MGRIDTRRLCRRARRTLVVSSSVLQQLLEDLDAYRPRSRRALSPDPGHHDSHTIPLQHMRHTFLDLFLNAGRLQGCPRQPAVVFLLGFAQPCPTQDTVVLPVGLGGIAFPIRTTDDARRLREEG